MYLCLHKICSWPYKQVTLECIVLKERLSLKDFPIPKLSLKFGLVLGQHPLWLGLWPMWQKWVATGHAISPVCWLHFRGRPRLSRNKLPLRQGSGGSTGAVSEVVVVVVVQCCAATRMLLLLLFGWPKLASAISGHASWQWANDTKLFALPLAP